MGEYKGLKKEDHEKLQRAVTTHKNITGESVDISGIPVYNEEEDLKAKQAKATAEFERKSKVDNELEKAQQRARQIERDSHGGGDVQSENPGPGQPAMVTERAKEQGVSRAGEEPDIAGGSSKGKGR